ncbi:hypothetical protein FG379_000484 [Cryptosporidium bovis]|uniref:uncharacterized protein n=1 Tax=Cryptosporidium bovis TaxID=310047 RepID=UPI00351A32DB|nr:hypothetical protein FG379_000484 [Cryptosporidium bovis]
MGVEERILEALNTGYTSLDEIMSKREFGGKIGGYTRMRGMIRYFLEQEIYVHSLIDSQSNDEFLLDPFSCESFDEHRSQFKIGRFGSRNVYTFASIPTNTLFGTYFLDVNSEDLSYNPCEDKFEDCVIKLYDFTKELDSFEDFENFNLSEEFSRVKNSSLNYSDSKSQVLHEVKLNEMLDIISIVEFKDVNEKNDDILLENHFDSKERNTCKYVEEKESRYSLTFHVISYKKIPSYSPIRCVEVGYDGFKGNVLPPKHVCEILNSLIKIKFPNLETVADLYNMAVNYIAKSVCEDNYVLAEYILLCICNRRKLQFESRNEVDNHYKLPPIVLHISFCDKGFVKRLREFLQRNISRITWLDLDISTINNSHITPHFDEEKNKFITGSLQFPLYRNIVVIDETTLQEGELASRGIENMSNVASLVNYGRVNYGFPAYQVPIETETNNIILSDNGKSVVCSQLDISISSKYKVTAKGKIENKEPFNLERELINYLGLYISIVSSCEEMIHFDKSTQEYIADKFVEIRQKLSPGDTQIHPSIIHNWILLSRTQALLNGEESLTSLRFDKFIQLEKERLNI